MNCSSRFVAAAAGVAACLFASVCAHASVVNVSGDLGTASVTGAFFSPINSSTITNFSLNLPGVGSIVGDVFANNTAGSSFALRITNLTYTAIGPTGLLDVEVVAQHLYQTSGTGSYNTSHQLTGFWSTASNNAVQLDSILDFNVSNFSLPTISQINTGNTTSFNVGSAASSTTSSAMFLVQTTLRMRIDGAGSIVLLSSADTYVDFVPAPGAMAIAGLSAAFAVRRRR
jgi:hypothetical protein